MPELEEPFAETPSRPRKRRRAAAACTGCHARKVRCSISQTGAPCTNCALDNAECRLRIGKWDQRLPVRAQVATPHPRRPSPSPPAAQAEAVDPPDTGVVAGEEEPGTPFIPIAGHFSHHKTQSAAEAHRTSSTPPPGDELSPLYGDPRGIGLVAELCQPERPDKSGHFLVPPLSSSALDLATIDFLKARGVFDVPSADLRRRFAHIYLLHVHPFFPIVDPHSFAEAMDGPDPGKLSLHLLWSVCLAVANFAEPDTLRVAGFMSRKEMKKAMFLKTKALYDADYERDKITLIQAVLLMGFWYADTEDRLGPWHWNGVALSLCTTIGLHRRPDASLHRQSSSQGHLWQQIWWACLFRETWLSAGMGRPMRIELGCCNTPKPSPDFFDGHTQTRALASPSPAVQRATARLWHDLLNITACHAEVLATQHKVPVVHQTRASIDRIEATLTSFHRKFRELEDSSTDEVLLVQIYHADLFLDSALINLYRPAMLTDLRLTPSTGPPHVMGDSAWQASITKKARAAASRMNTTLGTMMSNGILDKSQALICIAIVPALQTHLLQASSANSSTRKVGSHLLSFCMLVVEELRHTYFGAEILHRLFMRAHDKIKGQLSDGTLRPPDHEAGSLLQDSAAAAPSDGDAPWPWETTAEHFPHSGDSDIDFILSQCMFPDFSEWVDPSSIPR